ncbi:hypothetical protein BCR44DRAFT_1252141 [Catenaria anguillulae PL171]|uniref:F-box domain-containing protein n=1 Tax=Catenaria anguillulae PL171 TaxID=765915 RepID=A0A1Y2I115_9FUNG|nr:hypothetical protein BCR44DRAFT_1252141 [Catenaria anguillulae PL171]
MAATPPSPTHLNDASSLPPENIASTPPPRLSSSHELGPSSARHTLALDMDIDDDTDSADLDSDDSRLTPIPPSSSHHHHHPRHHHLHGRGSTLMASYSADDLLGFDSTDSPQHPGTPASPFSAHELQGDPADGAFRKLPHELISAIFNSLPKLSRYQCLFLNRRLSRIAASCLWRSIGCWTPSFPESRLSRVLDVLESDMYQTEPFQPDDHCTNPADSARGRYASPDTSLVPSRLMYPYLSFIRKIVIMVYNISGRDELFLFITRVRRVLLERCSTTRRLTLAYRGPLSWALDADVCIKHPNMDHQGRVHSDCERVPSMRSSVLAPMAALSQLGIYWVSEVSVRHLAAVATHCRHLRLLHIQPDRTIQATGILADDDEFELDGRADSRVSTRTTNGGGGTHPGTGVGVGGGGNELGDGMLVDDQAAGGDDVDAADGQGTTAPNTAATSPALSGHQHTAHGQLQPPPNPDDLVADIMHSNARGKLRELNLWHLPVSGAYFNSIPFLTLRMVTLGNIVVPEKDLLAMAHPLPYLSALTIDHPRTRGRRVPYGLARLISLASNLSALYLKHVVFTRDLAVAMTKCTKLSTLTLAPHDARSAPVPWVDFAGNEPDPQTSAAGTVGSDPHLVARELIMAESRQFSDNLSLLATHCPLTSLDLAGMVNGQALQELAGMAKLRELRIKFGHALRNIDIRLFVEAIAAGRPVSVLDPILPASSSSSNPQPPLRTLHICSASHLTDPGLLQLVYSIPTLRHLQLTETQIGPETLWFLAARGLGSLKKLTLSGHALHPRDLQTIRQRYPAVAKRIDVVPLQPRPGGAAAGLHQHQHQHNMAAAWFANNNGPGDGGMDGGMPLPFLLAGGGGGGGPGAGAGGWMPAGFGGVAPAQMQLFAQMQQQQMQAQMQLAMQQQQQPPPQAMPAIQLPPGAFQPPAQGQGQAAQGQGPGAGAGGGGVPAALLQQLAAAAQAPGLAMPAVQQALNAFFGNEDGADGDMMDVEEDDGDDEPFGLP